MQQGWVTIENNTFLTGVQPITPNSHSSKVKQQQSDTMFTSEHVFSDSFSVLDWAANSRSDDNSNFYIKLLFILFSSSTC